MNLHPIARHEAGHFVVAMRMGHVLLDVSIVPDGDRTALARSIAGPIFGSDRKRITMEQAVVYLSGPAAEGRFVDAVSPSCADNDVFDARLQFAGVEEAERDRLMGRAQRWAAVLVQRWRDDIDRLAAALLEYETMSGDEVIELFGGRPVEDPYRPRVTTDTEPDEAA